MADFRLNEPNDYKIFCGWLVHHWMSYSRLLPLQLLKEIYARSSHTQSVLSIMLGYLASGDTFEDLKFINAISPQSIGILILETCLLLGRQMITKRILCKTVYRLFNIFSLHTITTRWSVISCSINYCTILLTV